MQFMTSLLGFIGDANDRVSDIVFDIEYRLGFDLIFYWPIYHFINSLIYDYLWGVIDFWQRGRRGYAYRDTYSLDYYIISWLPEALDELAEWGNSYPGEVNGFPEYEDWKSFLRSISGRLRRVREVENSFFADYSIEEYVKEDLAAHDEATNALHDLADHFFHLWD